LTAVTIAIDAMGGDYGPPVTIPAAVDALSRFADLRLIMVGDADTLKNELRQYQFDAARLTIQHASQTVAMDELPSQALRTKKDSSMRVAIDLVKEGRADACVSAGNTGALMMTARFVLKTLPGIDRPAIISALPTYRTDKVVRILDLGANVESSAENLVQFAVMGSVLASVVGNIQQPKVYLLNIGEEEIKGNEQVKQTAQLLTDNQIVRYAGYIEGDKMYQGEADVIVCDGFIGNIVLKNTEGVAVLIKTIMKEAFMRSWMNKLLGLMVKPVMKSFAHRIDPGHYNGATLIGLQGTVIKSHGSANASAFTNAIKEAMMGAQCNIPVRIRDEVEKLLKNLKPAADE
jgi:glycerol-3-phosphate acyltransferase PlsX